MLWGILLLPDLEKYYKSSIPDFILAAMWFIDTTKYSHAYVTIIDDLIILNNDDPNHASGFHFNHHIDDKSLHAQSYKLGVRIMVKEP